MTDSITKERLATFSDSIFAVIITIMVLQLRLPEHATFRGLLDQWPTALSYVVSYLLIVIMWINHHFLWSFTKHSTPKLIVWNFIHMLTASLVPFATAWVASARMASVPVFVYAAVIVLVNLSYHGFALEVMHTPNRRTALMRSALTLALFTSAMLISLKLPFVAFALVTGVLVTYARPELPTRHPKTNDATN
jgi:uncharacterized membrane protein